MIPNVDRKKTYAEFKPPIKPAVFNFEKIPDFCISFPYVFMPNKNGGFAAAILVLPVPALAAGNAMCDLVVQLQSVFKILRTFAFVGAGFILAKYGWEAITSGKLGGKDNIADGLKAVGVPMIVGFALLFSIGIVLGFLSNGANLGCPAITQGW